MMIQKENSDKLDPVSVGMYQIHGSNVVTVSSKDAGKLIDNCDGLVTNDPGVYLKISVADCIPLALFDPINKCVGLVHAGWRGLDGEIISNAVHVMSKNFGTNPAEILAEIGPHICRRHYEIKADLAEKFSGYDGVIERTDGKMFLDLEKVAIVQLKKLGVKFQNIETDKRCTFEDNSLPSYRRGDLKKRVHYLLGVPKSS